VKIAVSSTGTSLDSQVDPRFGRCQYFIIVDTDTMDFEAVENPNVMAMGGAGIQSAQLVANKGAEVVLTGNCGPNAFQTFAAAGVKVIVGVVGTIKDVVERYKRGELQPSAQPNVASHFGMGPSTPQPPGMGGGPGMSPGPGGGFGMGGGRGMGRGRGRGMGGGFGMGAVPQGQFPGTPAAGPSQENLGTLVEQVEALHKQLREINQRLERLEKKK
jgi:predicted Fe-Mo cluster-binding NifX family protein